MATAREAFLETTARLLETQGYAATGLNQIVAESGAPKGSLYYYFPDGKEGLAVEVVAQIGREIAGRIRRNLDAEPDAILAIHQFLDTIAASIEASDCQGGGPIATVALETANSSTRLREVAHAAYTSWQAAFAEKLVSGGFAAARAERLAVLIIAIIEGTTILARTAHSATPLRQAAEEVRFLLESVQANAR